MGKTASKLQVLNLDEKYFLCKIPPVLGEETFGLLQAQNKTSREKALGDSTKATKRKVGSNPRKNFTPDNDTKGEENILLLSYIFSYHRRKKGVVGSTEHQLWVDERCMETWSPDTVSRDQGAQPQRLN